MGLFSNIRKKESIQRQIDEYFKMITGYSPAFSSFEGSIYEMELTRAAIHSFANHVSKLKPQVKGSGNELLQRTLQYRPNALMDTKKYLYRLATILSVDNTAIIAPLRDNKGNLVGYYPLLTERCQIVKDEEGNTYLRYDFGNGHYGACEFKEAGIMTQFQYKNELFGESNEALRPTLDLIGVQNQGIANGIKNAAAIRFIAKLGSVLKREDVEKERKALNEINLGADNNGGVFLVDQKYSEIKQVESRPYIVSAGQIDQIQENVYLYFGTNSKIIQNKYNSEEWNAYYEGKVEPFAIEASLVHTNMTFNEREIAFGNEIVFTANRLQYLSGTEKLNIVTQLFDRGFLTHNEGLEIFNMAGIGDEGDKRYIRREYVETDNLNEEMGVGKDANNEGQTVSSNDDTN